MNLSFHPIRQTQCRLAWQILHPEGMGVQRGCMSNRTSSHRSMDVTNVSHPTRSSAPEGVHLHLCELWCRPLCRFILRSGIAPGLILDIQDRNSRAVTLQILVEWTVLGHLWKPNISSLSPTVGTIMSGNRYIQGPEEMSQWLEYRQLCRTGVQYPIPTSQDIVI